MRGVIDESVPRKLASLLREAGCRVDPFPPEWKGLTDGALLDLMETGGHDVLLTCDRNMPFQQAIGSGRIALLILPGQRLAVLAPLVPVIADAVMGAKAGTVVVLDRAGRPVPPTGRE